MCLHYDLKIIFLMSNIHLSWRENFNLKDANLGTGGHLDVVAYIYEAFQLNLPHFSVFIYSGRKTKTSVMVRSVVA